MAEAHERELQGARTQSLFREVNERIGDVSDERVTEGEVLCECANTECVATLSITLDEYEAVRRIPTHFLIAPGHDLPEIERIVATNDRYVVVEKVGDAGRAAVRMDPRRREPGTSAPGPAAGRA